jgi:phosphoglycerate dehydrogenase-like enzyme
MPRVAILDDYAGLALDLADWSPVQIRSEVTVFDRHLSEAEAADALRPFDVICTVRERMALPRTLIERLPNLKLITIIGKSLPNLDMAAASERGVLVAHSNFASPRYSAVRDAAPELAWGLMIATVRNLAEEHRGMRDGGWQTTMGMTLSGKTLGLLGLGRIGRRMAEYANVFGMQVIAWSQNLTEEAATAVGARRVEKATLFEESDVVSIHMVLSERTRGLVAEPELALMKPQAYEPPPADHPLRALPNVTLSPHLGYVTREMLAAFYSDTVEAVAAWLNGTPIRIANLDALQRPDIN